MTDGTLGAFRHDDDRYAEIHVDRADSEGVIEEAEAVVGQAEAATEGAHVAAEEIEVISEPAKRDERDGASPTAKRLAVLGVLVRPLTFFRSADSTSWRPALSVLAVALILRLTVFVAFESSAGSPMLQSAGIAAAGLVAPFVFVGIVTLALLAVSAVAGYAEEPLVALSLASLTAGPLVVKAALQTVMMVITQHAIHATGVFGLVAPDAPWVLQFVLAPLDLFGLWVVVLVVFAALESVRRSKSLQAAPVRLGYEQIAQGGYYAQPASAAVEYTAAVHHDQLVQPAFPLEAEAQAPVEFAPAPPIEPAVRAAVDPAPAAPVEPPAAVLAAAVPVAVAAAPVTEDMSVELMPREVGSNRMDRGLLELAERPTLEDRPDRGPEKLRFHVEGLNTWYGSKQALENINLDIFDRRITAFVGPSGCGKSTFLRCLNRMNDLVPGFRSEGTIMLDGHDVRGRDVDVAGLRAAVGMVFQHPNPFPMSIYDNIALGVRQHKPRIRKAELDDVVEASLRQANLWDEIRDDLKRSAFSVSGGQQQRLCIARALAVKPEFIMLDEPCASLDPVSTSHIERLLVELSVEYPIVIVTHNLAQAHRIADTVAFFLMGKLLETGETNTIFTNPALPETRQYLEGAYG